MHESERSLICTERVRAALADLVAPDADEGLAPPNSREAQAQQRALAADIVREALKTAEPQIACVGNVVCKNYEEILQWHRELVRALVLGAVDDRVRALTSIVMGRGV